MDITGIGAVSDLIGTVVNKIFPDKSQQEKEQLAAAVMVVQGQLEINKIEAASTNWFVAGARPFIMWGCGFAMLYVSLFEPIARFVSLVCFQYTGPFPEIDTSLTTQVLLGILGLGGLRSIEKIKGSEGNR